MLSYKWVFAALTGFSALVQTAAFSAGDLSVSKDAITLAGGFNYAVPGYDYRPHHARTPFAVSSGNGNTYVAYLSGNTVYVQQVDHANGFAAVGSPAAVSGLVAGGLVAHDDGFALLTTRKDGTTANGEPTAYLVRYQNGKETWATPLNGKNAADDSGMTTSSDVLDGDLTWNGTLYGAYFVVHGASGWTEGHYGDSIVYVNADGSRRPKDKYGNTWGCSHNEGIAIAPSASQPFLTLCSNDWQTGIYLNTDTRTMSGPKISNDMTTAGYAGEPFGGVQGSYSNIAQFSDGSALVAWQTHGASATADGGAGATMDVLTVTQRWDVHNVAVAPLKDKSTPLTVVSLTPGGAGDSNVKFVTKVDNIDHVNVRTATYSDTNKIALVTYETVISPKCTSLGTTCTGTYTGTTFQLVNAATGDVVDGSFTSTDTFVAGNIVTLPSGELAWPYVSIAWDLSASASTSKTTTRLSFAKLSTLNGSAAASVSSTKATSSTNQAIVTSSGAPVSSSATSLPEASLSQSADAPTETITSETSITTSPTAPETTASEETSSTSAATETSATVSEELSSTSVLPGINPTALPVSATPSSSSASVSSQPTWISPWGGHHRGHRWTRRNTMHKV